MPEYLKRQNNQKTPLSLLLRCKGTVRCVAIPSSVTALCLSRCSPMLMLFIGILTILGHSEGAPALRHNNMLTYVYGGIKCFKCGPGTYVVNHCTEDFTYSFCEPCVVGTYQSYRTQSTRCEPCLDECLHDRNMVVIQNCSATMDIKCECKPGYYLHILDDYMDHYVCRKHKVCPPGQVLIKNGTSTSDNECSHCPVGQFYLNGQCENCTDGNTMRLGLCHSTANPARQSSHTTVSVLPNMTTSGSSPLPVILWPIVGGVTVLFFAIVVVITLYCCKRSTGEQATKSIDLNDSSTRPMLERSVSASSTSARKRTWSHRTLSNSSDNSTVTVPTTLSISLELQDRSLWTREVFDLLSQLLSTNWQRFMRLLPGDRQYKSRIDARCAQIMMEEPGNVQEQIHKALREWDHAHYDDIVNVKNILDTLMRLGDSRVYEQVRSLCFKLAKKQILRQREESISEL